MAVKKKQEMELRFYEVPQGELVLPLLGDSWIREYGNDMTKLHFHNLLEIGYCIDGEGEMVFMEEIVPYSPGMVTMIPKNYPHTTNSRLHTKSYWEYLFFDPDEILQSVYPNDALFCEKISKLVNESEQYYFGEENEELKKLILMIMEECRVRKNYSGECIRGLLLSLVMTLARQEDKRIGKKEAKGAAGSAPTDATGAKDAGKPQEGSESKGEGGASGEKEKVKKQRGNIYQISGALEYISKHYMDEIYMEILADCCNLSETHFRRIFRECMNMTPVEYINLVRIQQSIDMMNKTHYSMEELAQRVGYQNISTFNRNFRKMIGTSPYQYKKNSNNFEGKLLNVKVSAKKGW